MTRRPTWTVVLPWCLATSLGASLGLAATTGCSASDSDAADGLALPGSESAGRGVGPIATATATCSAMVAAGEAPRKVLAARQAVVSSWARGSQQFASSPLRERPSFAMGGESRGRLANATPVQVERYDVSPPKARGCDPHVWYEVSDGGAPLGWMHRDVIKPVEAGR